MPEIGEVALTAQILEKYFKNKTLISFDFVSGRYKRNKPKGYTSFNRNLPMKVKAIDSVGKFMWFELVSTKNNSRWYIWNTFGMTGMWSRSELDFTRAILTFAGNKVAYFSDMRNFATFKFSNDEAELDGKIKKLSPDFLKDDFNLDSIKKYNIPVVKILMDQNKVGSGLGNHLVAEILYRAKISPYALGSQLSDREIKNLTYWIKYIVKLSYMDDHSKYLAGLQKELKSLRKINYHPDVKLREKRFKFLVYKQDFDPKGHKVKADKIIKTGSEMRTTYWVPAVQK